MLNTPFSKRELYESAREKWPSSFRIVLSKSTGENIVTDPSDYDVYRRIEDSLGEKDDWVRISAWAFYQALGEIIKQCFHEKKLLLLSRMISFELFDRKLKANLLDASWWEERAIYDALPER